MKYIKFLRCLFRGYCEPINYNEWPGTCKNCGCECADGWGG